MIDFSGVLLSANHSALKLWKQGSGEVTIPARGVNDSKFAVATIPHEYGSDDLYWEVGFNNPYTNYTMVTPFLAGGGSWFTSYLDSANLYFEAGDSTASVADPTPLLIPYTYRIFIP